MKQMVQDHLVIRNRTDALKASIDITSGFAGGRISTQDCMWVRWAAARGLDLDWSWVKVFLCIGLPTSMVGDCRCQLGTRGTFRGEVPTGQTHFLFLLVGLLRGWYINVIPNV